MILVDTCVWLDVLENDPRWHEWSREQMDLAIRRGGIAINPLVYAELAVGFDRVERLDGALQEVSAQFEDLPRSALFLAGKAFGQYRARHGTHTSVLPDFFIGAHAAVREWPVLTRDPHRIRGYFPAVTLLTPATT